MRKIPEKTVTKEKPKDAVVHVSAMGDMLAHGTIIENAKTGDSSQ